MTVATTASQEGLKSHLSIDGGVGLNGVMTVSGAKNSALVLMTASLLTNETVELCNVPDYRHPWDECDFGSTGCFCGAFRDSQK